MMMKPYLKFYSLLCLLVIASLSSCNENYTPKPHGYFRFDLPEKEYRTFDSIACPYQFQYPVYGKLVNDQSANSEPYWFNLEFPAYGATIYLSYKKLNNNIALVTEDIHNLIYKHTIKADAIFTQPFERPEMKISGFLYDIGGNAASSVQFYLTDSTQHFLRGSLYFYATPNRDSLTPLIAFFKDDIIHLMETVEFRNKTTVAK